MTNVITTTHLHHQTILQPTARCIFSPFRDKRRREWVKKEGKQNIFFLLKESDSLLKEPETSNGKFSQLVRGGRKRVSKQAGVETSNRGGGGGGLRSPLRFLRTVNSRERRTKFVHEQILPARENDEVKLTC